MGKRGGPRRPDRIVDKRRQEVAIRYHAGMTGAEISRVLQVNERIVQKDITVIKRGEAEPRSPEGIKVRAMLVGRLLILDAEIAKLEKDELKAAKKGRKKVTYGLSFVAKKKQEKTAEDLLQAVVNELVPIEEIIETLLPRISGIAALKKLRIEICRLIGLFFGLGTTTKEVYSHTETIKEAHFIMGPKLDEEAWAAAAKGFKEGEVPRLITDEEIRGD